ENRDACHASEFGVCHWSASALRSAKPPRRGFTIYSSDVNTMNCEIAYQSGQFIAATQLSLSVHDAGFVWGATVTDRARTFNGKLFRLDEHLRRFRASCELARVPLNHSNEQLATISERLVAEAGGGEQSIIWIATPGAAAES